MYSGQLTKKKKGESTSLPEKKKGLNDIYEIVSKKKKNNNNNNNKNKTGEG